ncbi:hypothetical protein F9C11_38805 [Amycolatopsis sp. VS8301801F10]|uniref:hypothetical protein n=1 Tax=Amycolatopsis sp. VS8301801F10 TaxID=2652442 RepID=UPI0038FC7329
MIPTYMRARDHRALPYAHFYARNGYDMERILHTHVLNVVENPFATLRLAAALLFLSALGLIVAGVTFVDPVPDDAIRLARHECQSEAFTYPAVLEEDVDGRDLAKATKVPPHINKDHTSRG